MTVNQAFDEAVTKIENGAFEEAGVAIAGVSPNSEHERVEKLYLEGLLKERQGLWTEAVEHYRDALDIDDQHVETLFRLAYVLDLHGEDEEAIELYRSCIEEPPSHINAMMNLAVLCEDHGRYDDALNLISGVLEQDPNHERARLFLKDIESSRSMYYDEDRERTREKHDAVLDIPLSDFELSVRSRNCLKQMNLHTLGDLLRVTEQKLLAYKNFGETSLNEIKALLSSKGLRLGQALEEPGAPAPTSGQQPSAPPPAVAAGDPNLLNRSVAELELSVRSRKCLQRLGVSTLGELIQRSEPELLSIKNFGQTSLSEIGRRLNELGLTLRKDS